MPRCQTDFGCPVKSHARDEEVQYLVDNYIYARNCFKFPYLERKGWEILEKIGLTDSFWLLEMENVVQESMKNRADQDKFNKAHKDLK